MKKFILPIIGIVLALTGIGFMTYGNFNTQDKIQPVTAVAEAQPKPATVEELLARVNEERAKVGVAPLTIDPMLNTSAQWKSNDEVTFNYEGHIKPGTSNKNGLDYLNSLDTTGKCVYVSENLAFNHDKSVITTEQAMDAWMDSKAHREALLDAKYSTTGFGINGWAVTEHFCQLP